MRKSGLFLRLSVLLVAVILLLAFLPIAAMLPANAAPVQSQKTTEYLMRAREFFDAYKQKVTANAKDPNEVIRVMVELDAEAVADAFDACDYTDEAQRAEDAALKAQTSIIKAVETLVGHKVINRTAYLFNGFSIEMKRSDMRKVEAVKGVKSVYPVTAFEQEMASAIDMTSAVDMWKQDNGGYTGEGIVISIVDSGINYEHPDMVLDDGAAVKYTEEQMAEKIAALGYGKFYTDKVPFGYSYGGKMDADVNNNLVDHGLHVAGIAAANGTVTGVAPNAQLFAMQVFTDEGNAYTDDIIKAVEDSVKLGADIINLSLGSGSGFYGDVDFLQRALAYAEANGIVCCVAAGNNGLSSSLYGDNLNDWGLVDSGSVATPSTYPGALSVASVENTFIPQNVIDIYANGELFAESYPAWDFSSGAASDWTFFDEVVLVDCGLGDYWEDFDNIPEDEPYIALIERGVISFEEKLENACLKGSVGVIVYNRSDSSDYGPDDAPTNLGAGSFYSYNDMPAIAVSATLGEQLKALAEEGAAFSFNGIYTVFVANQNGGMSTFSSWGPTPTLDIKPEISAPGGYILSLSFGDGYDVMSGTSMAAPYVSGSSALVLQALKEAVGAGELVLGDTLTLNTFIKQSMMNTADPIMDGSNIYPVRQQGAGMIDPLEAANNRVLATYDGLSGVALKEVGKETVFTVTLTNYGTAAVTYTLPQAETVYTDYIDPATAEYSDVEADAAITFDKQTVTVPAGGTATVTCTLKVGGGAEENHYLEGFIRFDGEIDLRLPVLAFYGDWETAERIVDLPSWDPDNILTNFYSDYFMLPFATHLFGDDFFLGLITESDLYNFDPEHLAFSPNGDGYAENVQPVLGMLRSAGKITVDVLDENKKVIRRINTVENVTKKLGYDIYGEETTFKMLAGAFEGDGVWDGTIYDPSTGSYVPAEEGQYYISVKASLPGSDVVEETIMPVRIDVTSPTVEILNAAYIVDDYGDGAVSIQFRGEDISGIADLGVLYINGGFYEFTPSYEAEYDEETDSYMALIYDWNGLYVPGEMNEIGLIMMDYAQNEGYDFFYTDVTYTSPVIFANITNYEDELTVLSEVVTYGEDALYAVIRGSVDETVASVKANGIDARISANHSFYVEIPVTAASMALTVVAYDADGKEVFKTERKALVDALPPSVTAYVTDEAHSGEWSTDMLYCSYLNAYDGYSFATMYEKEDSIPVTVQAKDDTLLSLTVTWLEGDLASYEYDEFLWGYLYMWSLGEDTWVSDELLEKFETLSLTPEQLDANGRYTFDVPLYEYEYYEWETDLSFFYLEQTLLCEATDAAGNVTRWVTTLEGGELAENSYWLWGDSDVRDGESISDPMSGFNFVELAPLDVDWYINYMMGWAVATDDMLDENGVLHLTGTLPDSIYGVTYEGKYYEPDENGNVSFDVKLHPGANIVYYTLDHWWEPVKWRLTINYIPAGMETAISFDDERITDGAVIYTNEDVFTVSGEVFSLVGNVYLKINGDQLSYNTATGTNLDGTGNTIAFSYPVTLRDGKNYVSVAMMDDTDTVITVNFVVFKDTTPPKAPTITADENGNVTISSEEDDVTLYYSLDGKTWVPYTEALKLEESGTVYAKAVDAAGNESEIVKQEVKLPEPDESDKSDESGKPGKPDESNSPTTGDAGHTVYVALLFISMAVLIRCMRGRKFHA